VPPELLCTELSSFFFISVKEGVFRAPTAASFVAPGDGFAKNENRLLWPLAGANGFGPIGLALFALKVRFSLYHLCIVLFKFKKELQILSPRG
jgi:hypothetical protein